MDESEKNASKIRKVKDTRTDVRALVTHLQENYNSPEMNQAVAKLKEASHWMREYLVVLGDEDTEV